VLKVQTARSILLVFSLTAVLTLQGQAAPSRHRLSEYFKPRAQLSYLEVYHAESNSISRIGSSVENLIANHTDYVKLDAHGGSSAIPELYRALDDTTLGPANCSSADVRWAIVFNYTDKTREAVGFGRLYDCVELLTWDRFAASRPLWDYVHATFPFMH
jgi:hypothetical protein